MLLGLREIEMTSQRETLLQVDGMSCANCVRHVGEALRAIDGVTDVDVTLTDGRAVVRHGDGAEVAQMIAALLDAGYDARAA